MDSILNKSLRDIILIDSMNRSLQLVDHGAAMALYTHTTKQQKCAVPIAPMTPMRPIYPAKAFYGMPKEQYLFLS